MQTKLERIERDIKAIRRTLAATSDDNPNMPLLLACFGKAHDKRFDILHQLEDNYQAIENWAIALTLIPDNHPLVPSLVESLGTAYGQRFQRLGNINDINRAIEHGCIGVTLIPDGHQDLPRQLGNLGAYHKERFKHQGKLEDLEQAMEYDLRAIGLTPNGHPQLPSALVGLGGSHSYRFQRLGELADLEKAIQYQSCALDLTPDSHPHLSSTLANLGAIQYQSRAAVSTPDAHPHLALIHNNQATSCFLYYQYTGHLPHLQQSLHSSQIASYSTTSAPRDRFRHARQWATRASRYNVLNPIEAYQATIDLLPQFIWLGTTTSQRYEDLSTAETLAVDAAHVAILSSEHALALEWLEHARCVVWTQNMMLRSPLDRLHSSHPGLSTALQAFAERLHTASSESRESLALASGSMNEEQVAQEHRSLAQRYNDLLTQIRTLPGFEDFLCPIKANRLVRVAPYGAVVVINCHRDRCDALIILPGKDTVDHLSLPHFKAEKASHARRKIETSLDSLRSRERGVERRPLIESDPDQVSEFETVLAELWSYIVKPVLDFLGYTTGVPSDNLPHITWCPTGALSFLPLHAAGDYDQPGSRVYDYVVSSYTPTLTALLECTPTSLNRNSGILAVGQAATPGQSRLPGTATEISLVKAHTQHKVRYSQLMDQQATTSAVLKAMQDHDWVHLACHAHQNVGNATASGFFLHDGTLDIAEINRRSFKNKGLAFLSACQTAKGDDTLPDEAVHLASGMLMAGYSSVIATMWSVVDEDAPIVADGVYAWLMKGGKLGSGEAGRALHDAVAVLRGKVGEKAFERWVPYIHIGS
ncbi:unnamed protein product [Rhizoctonia solani]|uniref:CHAT domain-containing protein n=1 Tax=Rhizoctonia solani TaxID=456999 RepID=A0A8H3HA67_9AGAM|nr:unnamed protein product [Rhizoctonia solani]